MAFQMDPQIRPKNGKIGFGRGSGWRLDFGSFPGASQDRPMWLKYNKYHIQVVFDRSLKVYFGSPFVLHFGSLWVPFGRFRGLREGIKKRLKNGPRKLAYIVQKWLPNGLAGSRVLASLEGPVGHLDPEVPHKEPQGSKIVQNLPKNINIRVQF